MLKHLFSKPRRQILILAISLSVLAFVGITGASAYLTDVTEPYSAPLNMRYGNQFAIDIFPAGFKDGDSGQTDLEIIPGGTIYFDPCLANNGNYDTYVFMKVTIPNTDLQVLEISDDWQLLYSDVNTSIYYYGQNNEMRILPAMSRNDTGDLIPSETSPLDARFSLAENTKMEQGTYDIQATGYAIQADGINKSDPLSVWKMIGAS